MGRFDTTSLLWSMALAALWAILAALSPDTTFHLAPALIPLAVLLAITDRKSSTRSRARNTVLIAGSIAVATSLGLQVAGNLRGPSLLPAGGALLESLVMAGFGVAAGLVIVARTARSDPSASPSS